LVAGPWAVKREKEGCCEAAAQFQIFREVAQKESKKGKKNREKREGSVLPNNF
jgi:hypothetical protein